MSTELVSVVIPCFNREKHIGDCTRSAANQTYHPVETIVVDDGSSDRSVEIVRSLGASNVRCISVPNGGAARARNIGLKEANGRFVHFLDSDDLLPPNAIADKVKFLETFPDTQAVYSRVFVPSNPEFSLDDVSIPSSLGELLDGGRLFPRTGMGETIAAPLAFSTPTLYERRVLEEHGGFDESYTVWDNIELNFRLYLEGVTFQLLDRIGYVYRDDRDISRITDDEHWHSEALYRDFSRMMRYAKQRGMLRGELKQDFEYHAYKAMKMSAAHGKVRQARDYYALLQESSPEGVHGSTAFRLLAKVFGPAFGSWLTQRPKHLLTRI